MKVQRSNLEDQTMQLMKNATSPFARIAHASLIEAGLGDSVEPLTVDHWGNDPRLMAVNSTGRIPCLVLDDGTAIAESLLIAAFAAANGPQGVVLKIGDAAILSLAGLSLGICDAAVQTLIGRRILAGDFKNTRFDDAELGNKRRFAMTEGLTRLDAQVPDAPREALDLGLIAAVTAVDYVHLRFPGAEWVPDTPRLTALEKATSGRPSLARTVPVL